MPTDLGNQRRDVERLLHLAVRAEGVDLATPEAVVAEEQDRLIEAVVGGLEVSTSAKARS